MDGLCEAQCGENSPAGTEWAVHDLFTRGNRMLWGGSVTTRSLPKPAAFVRPVGG